MKMPPRKRRPLTTAVTIRRQSILKRQQETPEERFRRLETSRLRTARRRALVSEERHELQLPQSQLCELKETTKRSKVTENENQREIRLRNLRQYAAASRAAETNEQRESRLRDLRERARRARATESEYEREWRLRDMRERAKARARRLRDEQRRLQTQTTQMYSSNDSTQIYQSTEDQKCAIPVVTEGNTPLFNPSTVEIKIEPFSDLHYELYQSDNANDDECSNAEEKYDPNEDECSASTL